MDIKNSEKIFQFLENIHAQFEEISHQLTLPQVIGQHKKFRELSKKLVSLKPLEEKHRESRIILKQLSDVKQMIENGDPEMLELAQEEQALLEQERDRLQGEVEELMVTDSDEENRNVFLEIRSGAGGDEASLFVGDLLRMYTRMAERGKWKLEVISTTYNAIGGIKEVILYIRGREVYKSFFFESGVHRVQRVPVTESSGRIHTSTVTVAVLPEAEDVEIEIDAKDLRIDTYAASGPGGQHVNKTESAIRITHFPTGIVVTCQDEKSQHKNRDKAMRVLKARLLEFEKTRQKDNIDQTRKSQVGSGERSEKIRTYNFPQNRVTDHRVNSGNYNIEFILDGDLEDLIEELHRERKKELIRNKIKELNDSCD